jgi:Family of unknown function (DUF5519)
MKYFEGLEQQVSSWPNVSSHPHRFGGREFRFGSAEIGHIHIGGAVDIPFPRSVRDALLAEGLADEGRLLLVPSPMSPVPIRSFRYPQDADIIGRVTGFAMLIAELRTDASATPSQGLATP